jgi:hypothetical protein
MTPTDLRTWHDASGLSTQGAADAIGISRRYYVYLLSGKTSAGLPIAALPRRIELAWRSAAEEIEKNCATIKKLIDSAH